MKHCLGIAIAATLAAASLSAQGALNLFNGSMLGWNPQGAWNVTNGALTSNGNGDRHMLTAVPFADGTLQFEYNESAPVGAKLNLWADRGAHGGLSISLDRSGSPSGVGGIDGLAHSAMSSVSEGWHRVQVEASGGNVRVAVDGQTASHFSGLGSRAGYLGFTASGNGIVQVRSITFAPQGLNRLFTGSDLSGWKTVARGPDSKGGMGHAFVKTLSFGAAGGTTKAHDAKWSVQGGSLRGESGPGGLENGTMAEDAIVQVSAAVKGEVKPDNYTALVLRNTPGQLGPGYAVGIGPYAGSIDPIAKRGPTRSNGFVDQTIVIAGRTIAVWVGSNLTQVHTDTRAENANPAQGAKTGAGSLALVLPNGGEQVDVRNVAMAVLPKTYGVAAKAPPPPPAPVVTTTQAVAPPPSAAETALLQEQQANAKKEATQQADRQRTASLMSQALATADPQQQMTYYGQVVQIDPSNAAAVQGFKEAQTRMQAQQAAQVAAQASEAKQEQNARSKEEQTNQALVQAQSAFLAGHLSDASNALSVAERLAPGNPLVRDLRSRIGSAQSLRSRLYWLGGGVGFLSLASALALWMRRRKQQRYAVLEITRGLDVGRTYPLDRDQIRIGAVAQDGGQRNDVVVQDVEHAISRFHCEVTRKNGQLYVTDLRSSNGTRLNGEPLKPGTPAPLRKGNRITLADSVDLQVGYGRRAKKDA